MRKAPKRGVLHPIDEDINRLIATVRAKVEHPIHVLKREFGYTTTRYRGLAKDRAQLFSLFALGNLYLVRRPLLKWRAESAESPGMGRSESERTAEHSKRLTI